MAEAEIVSVESLFAKVKENIHRLSNEESSKIDDEYILSTNKLIEECKAAVDREGLFSKNEEVDDVPTTSLKYLLLDYYLGKSHLQFKEPTGRKFHLLDGQRRYECFIKTCNHLRIITDSEVDAMDDDEGGPVTSASLAAKRERKIANYKAEKLAKERRRELEAIVSNCSEDIDREEELRELSLLQLKLRAKECINEMEMIETELTMLQLKETMDGGMHGGMHGGDGMQQATVNNGRGGGPPPGPSKGIEITVLSKDAMGEIVMERNTIKSSVFHIDKKMTVEQYGDQVLEEYNAATAEKANAPPSEENAPRRYSKLLEEGDEDDLDLVDKATIADRDWDAWKEANPRGWGNKAHKRF